MIVMPLLGVKTHASCPLVSTFTHFTVITNLSWGEHTLIKGEHILIKGEHTLIKGEHTLMKGGTHSPGRTVKRDIPISVKTNLKKYPRIMMLQKMLMIQKKL